MLVSLASVKGSPGVTSTALALAAVWPRPVVLLEADPAGGDLAYRCTAAGGGAVSPDEGLLQLAAAVRGGSPSSGVVAEKAQPLACGVQLIQGVGRPGQARAFSGLWGTIASACVSASVDVLADLGRLDGSSPVMPMVAHSSHLLTVASATLESVMHLRDGVADLLGADARVRARSIRPVLLGPDAHADRDRDDLDTLLGKAGVTADPSMSLALDAKALSRLERGDSPAGRLGRTLLLRTARQLAGSLTATQQVVSA